MSRFLFDSGDPTTYNGGGPETATAVRVERATISLPAEIQNPVTLARWLLEVSETNVGYHGYVDPTVFKVNDRTLHIFESGDEGLERHGIVAWMRRLRQASNEVPGSLYAFASTARVYPIDEQGVVVLAWDEESRTCSVGIVFLKRTETGWRCESPVLVPPDEIHDLRFTF